MPTARVRTAIDVKSGARRRPRTRRRNHLPISTGSYGKRLGEVPEARAARGSACGLCDEQSRGAATRGGWAPRAVIDTAPARGRAGAWGARRPIYSMDAEVTPRTARWRGPGAGRGAPARGRAGAWGARAPHLSTGCRGHTAHGAVARPRRGAWGPREGPRGGLGRKAPHLFNGCRGHTAHGAVARPPARGVGPPRGAARGLGAQGAPSIQWMTSSSRYSR